MESKKTHKKPQTKKTESPFVKILKDKRRIQEAIVNGVPLSSLSDIKFVHPI